MREMQIGDVFIINHKKIYKDNQVPNWKRCSVPDKRFTINKITPTLVGYIDNRTNIGCKCNYCQPYYMHQMLYNTLPDRDLKSKTISKDLIIITMTNKQRTRDISLKILLGKKDED